jgi:hypothetical protein
MATTCVAWVLALALPCSARAQSPSQESAPAGATRIVFHESPAIDLYFHVRALAGRGGTSPPEALRPAVDAARELDRALAGNPLAWGPLEGLLPGAETAADVVAAFARAPESIELRGGTKVPLRAGAQKLAAALVEVEPAFAEPWKEHARRTSAARKRWEEQVGPEERELFAFHLASLGMKERDLAVPVHLVAEGSWPGAVTHLDDAGRGVCFVAVDAVPGSLFHEIVLHEATHALDVAAGDESALGELRERLASAGRGRRDRAYHDLPHALMFVQSAESIRRTIDPAHRDYGEVEKVYERMGASAEAVRGFWRDHLDGKLSRAEALDGIVASLAPAPR